MKCIFVDPEFASLVDGYCEKNIPFLRLGARIVDNGPHKGRGLVPTDLISCSPEWTALFSSFVIGKPSFEVGTDIELRDAYGKVWTYSIHEVQDITELFNEPEIG
jgi:hypothetical protein